MAYSSLVEYMLIFMFSWKLQFYSCFRTPSLIKGSYLMKLISSNTSVSLTKTGNRSRNTIRKNWQLVLDTVIYEITLQNDERIGTIRCISSANRSTHSHVFITIPVHTLNPGSAVAGNKVLWTRNPFIMVYIEPISVTYVCVSAFVCRWCSGEIWKTWGNNKAEK